MTGPVEVEADDELVRLFAQYLDLKTIKDEVADAVAEVRDHIADLLPDRAVVMHNGAQLRDEDRRHVDADRLGQKLRRVYPEVAADVEKDVDQRPAHDQRR